MSDGAEELVAGVSGQTVDEQAEEDSGQDLTQKHRQTGLGLVSRRAQQPQQDAHTCTHTHR